MNIARSSFKLFLGNTANAVLGLVGITYFARELGAAPLGAYFLFEALLGMLAISTDFGLRGAVEKRISEGDDRGNFLTSAILLKLLLLGIVIVTIFVFRQYIDSYIGVPVAMLLIVALILREAASLSLSVLNGELRVGETAILRFARQATWLLAGGIFVWSGFETIGLIYGLIAGLTVVLIWGWYKVSIEFQSPTKKHAISLINYGKYNLVSGVGGLLYNWMDVALIGFFLSQSHVAAYEIAWRITSATLLFSRALARTIFPQISEWSAADAPDQIESLIPETLTPTLFLVVPAFAGSMLLADDILRNVFGPEYVIAALPLMILMFDEVTEAVQLVFGRSLQGIDRPDLAAIATIVGISLNLLLNVILIWNFGLIGAAVATTIASLVGGAGLHAYFLSRSIKIQLPTRELVGLALASIGMLLILYPFTRIFAVDSVISVVAFIGFGAVLYGGFVLFIPSLRAKVLYHSRMMLG